MNVALYQNETVYRGDFTFANSPQAIRRFPLPFAEDDYMYSVNIEPHLPGPQVRCSNLPSTVDEHYVAECRERAIVLAAGAAALSGAAAHDELAVGLPRADHGIPGARLSAHFSLERQGNRWHWINRPLGIDQSFTFGDPPLCRSQPLDYITRQAPGRLRGHGPARRRSVDRGRHGDGTRPIGPWISTWA